MGARDFSGWARFVYDPNLIVNAKQAGVNLAKSQTNLGEAVIDGIETGQSITQTELSNERTAIQNDILSETKDDIIAQERFRTQKLQTEVELMPQKLEMEQEKFRADSLLQKMKINNEYAKTIAATTKVRNDQYQSQQEAELFQKIGSEIENGNTAGAYELLTSPKTQEIVRTSPDVATMREGIGQYAQLLKSQAGEQLTPHQQKALDIFSGRDDAKSATQLKQERENEQAEFEENKRAALQELPADEAVNMTDVELAERGKQIRGKSSQQPVTQSTPGENGESAESGLQPESSTPLSPGTQPVPNSQGTELQEPEDAYRPPVNPEESTKPEDQKEYIPPAENLIGMRAVRKRDSEGNLRTYEDNPDFYSWGDILRAARNEAIKKNEKPIQDGADAGRYPSELLRQKAIEASLKSSEKDYVEFGKSLQTLRTKSQKVRDNVDWLINNGYESYLGPRSLSRDKLRITGYLGAGDDREALDRLEELEGAGLQEVLAGITNFRIIDTPQERAGLMATVISDADTASNIKSKLDKLDKKILEYDDMVTIWGLARENGHPDAITARRLHEKYKERGEKYYVDPETGIYKKPSADMEPQEWYGYAGQNRKRAREINQDTLAKKQFMGTGQHSAGVPNKTLVNQIDYSPQELAYREYAVKRSAWDYQDNFVFTEKGHVLFKDMASVVQELRDRNVLGKENLDKLPPLDLTTKAFSPNELLRVVSMESVGDPTAVSPNTNPLDQGYKGLGQLGKRAVIDVMREFNLTWNGKDAEKMTAQDFDDIRLDPTSSLKIMSGFLNGKNSKTFPDKISRLIMYNAGRKAAFQWQKDHDMSKLPKETRDYVKAILGDLNGSTVIEFDGNNNISGQFDTPDFRSARINNNIPTAKFADFSGGNEGAVPTPEPTGDRSISLEFLRNSIHEDLPEESPLDPVKDIDVDPTDDDPASLARKREMLFLDLFEKYRDEQGFTDQISQMASVFTMNAVGAAAFEWDDEIFGDMVASGLFDQADYEDMTDYYRDVKEALALNSPFSATLGSAVGNVIGFGKVVAGAKYGKNLLKGAKAAENIADTAKAADKVSEMGKVAQTVMEVTRKHGTHRIAQLAGKLIHGGARASKLRRARRLKELAKIESVGSGMHKRFAAGLLKSLRTGAIGAGQGALAGAGQAEGDVSDRAANAVIGAGVGFAAGTAFGGASELLNSAPVKGFFRRLRRAGIDPSSEEAANIISKTLLKGGASDDEVKVVLNALDEGNLPTDVATGQATRSVRELAASTSKEVSRGEVGEQLAKSRIKSQASEVTGKLEDLTGTTGKEASEAITKQEIQRGGELADELVETFKISPEKAKTLEKVKPKNLRGLISEESGIDYSDVANPEDLISKRSADFKAEFDALQDSPVDAEDLRSVISKNEVVDNALADLELSEESIRTVPGAAETLFGKKGFNAKDTSNPLNKALEDAQSEFRQLTNRPRGERLAKLADGDELTTEHLRVMRSKLRTQKGFLKKQIAEAEANPNSTFNITSAKAQIEKLDVAADQIASLRSKHIGITNKKDLFKLRDKLANIRNSGILGDNPDKTTQQAAKRAIKDIDELLGKNDESTASLLDRYNQRTKVDDLVERTFEATQTSDKGVNIEKSFLNTESKQIEVKEALGKGAGRFGSRSGLQKQAENIRQANDAIRFSKNVAKDIQENERFRQKLSKVFTPKQLDTFTKKANKISEEQLNNKSVKGLFDVTESISGTRASDTIGKVGSYIDQNRKELNSALGEDVVDGLEDYLLNSREAKDFTNALLDNKTSFGDSRFGVDNTPEFGVLSLGGNMAKALMAASTVLKDADVSPEGKRKLATAFFSGKTDEAIKIWEQAGQNIKDKLNDQAHKELGKKLALAMAYVTTLEGSKTSQQSARIRKAKSKKD